MYQHPWNHAREAGDCLTDAGCARRRGLGPTYPSLAWAGVKPASDLAFAADTFHRDGLPTTPSVVSMPEVTGLDIRGFKLDALILHRDDSLINRSVPPIHVHTLACSFALQDE